MDTRQLLQNTIDYIDAHIKSQITPADLSRVAGYSYVHLVRLFKLYLGVTPKAYLLRRRLLFAVYEMESKRPKTDIAFDFGFDTYAGFYKAFRREFGCSPSTFAKTYIGSRPYRINILQEDSIMVSKAEIQKILSHWDLQNRTVKPIISKNTGRQNENAYYVGDDHIIKYTANLAAVQKAILFDEVVKSHNTDAYLQLGELYFMVTKRMHGAPLCCRTVFEDPTVAYTIGENIADLHKKLSLYDPQDFPQANLYRDSMENLEQVQKIAHLTDDFCTRYKKECSRLYPQLPAQLIHRDLNPSNMIFDGKEFAGFIDFDLTEVNIRLFDLCYCATAILSECFGNAYHLERWKTILHNLIQGYHRVCALSEQEMAAVPYVIYSIQIICIAYFSAHDKYAELTKTNIQMLRWLIANL